MAGRAASKIARLNRETTAFLMCDMQERFRGLSWKFAEIAEVSRRLCLAAKIYKRPLLISEQYPKALGPTISELMAVAKDHATCIYPKTNFSMLVPEIEKHMKGIEHVVLFGIETHVCILQTTMDLLARGVDVHLVADATSSRCQPDRHMALERMRQAGAIISTCESTIFDLLRDKNSPEFKAISALAKTVSPDSGLLP